MSLTISLSFPWGRVHATPWERSANEAEPEWPPSPWRLLRALYSVWRYRCHDIDPQVVERLLGALVSAPRYRLPPHSVAHTRHYFPDPSHRSGASGATDKVFDTFVAIPADEPVLLGWAEVNLDPPTSGALGRLLADLPFLGRAESLCDASIVDTPEDVIWIEPLRPDQALAGRRPVDVLTAATPLDLKALLATTKDVRASGFADPPGSTRVRYALAHDQAPTGTQQRSRAPKATMASLGAHSNVLPTITSSLAMCELLRMSVQKQYGRLTGGAASATLSGKREGGAPRLDQHSHAHYLALSTGGHFIDRFVIWAPEGLDPDEVRAITALRELRPGARADADGGKDLRRVDVRLEALGDSSSMLADELTGPATTWRSVTPFITSRRLNDSTKRRLAHHEDPWAAFLVEEVQREADLRGFGTVDITPSMPTEGLNWLSFRRHRAYKAEKLKAAPRGGGFELRFSEPVGGPIALGAQSHFGLGVFVPVRTGE